MWVWSLGWEDPLQEGCNPLQYSCRQNPMDRGAWQATVHRVVESWAWFKCVSMHACSHLNVKVFAEVLCKTPPQDLPRLRILSGFTGGCTQHSLQSWNSKLTQSWNSKPLYTVHLLSLCNSDFCETTTRLAISYSQWTYNPLGLMWALASQLTCQYSLIRMTNSSSILVLALKVLYCGKLLSFQQSKVADSVQFS